MTFPRLRLDASIVFCVTLSVALHAALLAALWDDGSAQRTPVLSAIKVQLAAARPVSPNISTPVAPPEVKEIVPTEQLEPVTVEPEQPVVNNDQLAVEETPLSSNAPSKVAVPAVSLNPDSLRTFIDSNAKQTLPTLEEPGDIAAQYRELWHQRVQRIGQLNYPAAAAKLNRTGQLVLKVSINPNGTLASVAIIHSSGYDELDFAALDIVRQSQPFDPLPLQLPRENGQYRFLSTWEFRR